VPVPSDDPSVARDEQDLSDLDQTWSDTDQSDSDLDQTLSDADQRASERDQSASERDQHAADLDQAALARAQVGDDDPTSYARSRRARSQTSLERDITSQSRSMTAGIRDATAERRDLDAEARDAAASAREQLAAVLDAEIDQLENSRALNGGGRSLDLEILLRASHDRKRAAAGRARAAVQREEAARDRALAREDRERAAGDRRQAAEELAAEGTDHLTETMRRRVGLAAIQREIERIRRSGETLVVAFVDIDGLKAVNDSQGHAAGDELLRTVARCIQLQLRSYDVILRFGGDEFVCSLAGQDVAGVGDRFAQISAQIAEAHNGATISVGLVEGGSEESLDEMIGRADRVMIASRNGR
jgi:diguanylate cyclase (GGDEF)-like protein